MFEGDIISRFVVPPKTRIAARILATTIRGLGLRYPNLSSEEEQELRRARERLARKDD